MCNVNYALLQSEVKSEGAAYRPINAYIPQIPLSNRHASPDTGGKIILTLTA